MRTGILKPEEHFIRDEPYYECVGNEVEVIEAAYRKQLPVLLKGPTGCGKTRFVQHMAWRLQRPLITVSCHDDLTASDLVGRFLVAGGEATWVDGPLARGAPGVDRSAPLRYSRVLHHDRQRGAGITAAHVRRGELRRGGPRRQAAGQGGRHLPQADDVVTVRAARWRACRRSGPSRGPARA